MATAVDAEAVRRGRRRLWAASIALSVVLATALGAMWLGLSRHELDAVQLTDTAAVDSALDLEATGHTDPTVVPTGVFVESLAFESATDVHMTGYVWQRWGDHISPEVERGYVLPEMVVSSIPAQEEYRVDQEGHQLIGWYFEGTFRQQFSYDAYPFDHKTVEIRIWPREFGADVVLVPDFDAYPATGNDDIFGIESGIVLGDWSREDTYFDYLHPEYNTDFGIDGFNDMGETPELRFNVILRRDFASAFIVNVVPLFVVAALAFGALLTVTKDEERVGLFGFNVSGVLATVSALFFVVLIAHTRLRQELPGAGMVYFEYLYFVMYVALLAVAISAHRAVTAAPGAGRLSRYGENLPAQLAYWPALLAAVLVITVVAFPGDQAR